jgi:hypothetical protein
LHSNWIVCRRRLSERGHGQWTVPKRRHSWLHMLPHRKHTWLMRQRRLGHRVLGRGQMGWQSRPADPTCRCSTAGGADQLLQVRAGDRMTE